MPSRLRELLPQSSSALIGILLAVLAVLVLAWVTFGLVRSGDEQGGQAADQEIVAQSQDSSADTPAPEAENRNVDSYAAYEAKDPFQPVVELADADTGDDIGGGDTGGDTSGGTSDGDDGSGIDSDSGLDNGNGDDTGDTGGVGTGGGSTTDGGASGGRGQGGQDSDKDGLNDRRESRLGQDPANPDTDGDGIQDGADDSNGDGRPDGRVGGRGGGAGGNNDLFDSGGSLLPSGK